MYTITLNTRTLRLASVWLCAGMALAGCGLVSGHGSLANGQKDQAEGKYRAAYIEAKKVLQNDQDNGAAWLLLGKASLMRGMPKDALNDFQKAKANGVSEKQLAVPVGRALRVTGQYDKLLKTLPADKSFKPDLQARIEVLRGDAYRGLDQAEKAEQAYQAALQLDPNHVGALLGLASVAAAAHHTASAHKYMKQAMAAAPDNPEVWKAKADMAFANKDLDTAQKAYQKALQTKGNDWLPQDRFVARMNLARVQMQQGHFDKALANIQTLEKMAPQQPQPHYLHAVVLYRQGHLDDAISQLQLVLKSSPNNVRAQFLMGAVNYAKANYGQAQMYLSNVMGMAPKSVDARKLLALTFYRQGRSEQALTTLHPLVSDKMSDAELLALMQRAAAHGPGHSKAGTPAQSASSRMQRMAPLSHSQNPQFDSVNQALASGNAAKAIKLLKAMPAGDDAMETQRHALLVKAYVLDKQVDKAVKSAADYASAHPNDSAAHLLYGTALVADRQHDKARAQYSKAYKLDPKNITALLNLGSLDVLDHHYKDAEDHYKTALKKSPHNVAAMIALGKLAMVQNDHAHAIKWLKQAIAAEPQFTGAYIRLIVLYSRLGQFDQAAETARQLVKAEPNNPVALNALGAAELNAGHHQKALKPLKQAVKLAPNNATYLINLAHAQVLLEKPEAAEDNLEKAIKAAPGKAKAATMLAFMKLHDHDLPGALALARTLQQQPATKMAGYSLEGDLYMASKSYGKAAKAYKQGLQVHHSRPLVIRQFMALKADGASHPEAGLRDWLAEHENDMAIRMLLAQYELGHGQETAATKQYQKILKAYPSNISALNNLAWLYIKQDKPQALTLATKAYKLAPKSAGVADTYAWALIADKQYKKALPILQQAAKAAPKSPTIQYHLAVAQARSGDRRGARTTLMALEKSDPKFPEHQAADKLYRQLGGSVSGIDEKSTRHPNDQAQRGDKS